MKVLYSAEAIEVGIGRVAHGINEHFRGVPLTVLIVLKGGVVFGADLIRRLEMPLELDTVRVSSYRNATTSGKLDYVSPPTMDLDGRDVLIVDDILDTGRTMSHLVKDIEGRGARSVFTAVLLDKPSRRTVPVQANYSVFSIPDMFVVGYGLDFDEKYRNLPHIAALDQGETEPVSVGEEAEKEIG